MAGEGREDDAFEPGVDAPIRFAALSNRERAIIARGASTMDGIEFRCRTLTP